MSRGATRLVWRGPGSTARLERPEEDVPLLAEPSEVDGADEADGDENVRDVISKEDVAQWIGEDGGPGDRDGLYAFLDDESVGAVLLPAVRGDALTDVLRFAMEWPQLFLFVPAAEPATDEQPDISCPVPNAVVLRLPAESSLSVESFVRYVESRDFREPGTRAANELSGEGANWSAHESEVVEILAWRCWRGLERSLDLGTRWTVFEPATPALLRSVDRDVRGFLRRLSQQGLLRRVGGYDVEIAFRTDEAQGADEGEPADREGAVYGDVRLVLHVEAELAAPYGEGMARVVALPSSLVGG